MNIIETIQLILNIVTIPVAIFTVLLLIRQTKQLEETLKSQVYQGLIDNSLKIGQLMIENPEYRKYVYDYEKIPEGDQDLDKLWGILDYALDVVDNVKAQERFIPKPYLPGWHAFMKLILEQPAVKYYLEKKYGFWFEGTLYHSRAESAHNKSPKESSVKIKSNPFLRIFRKKNIAPLNANYNSSVKSYLSPKVIVKPSKIGGLGTFAQSDIKKGEIVFVKGGHIVTRDELFYSTQISSYLPISDSLFVGATHKDDEQGIKLFVNHSCKPNCGLHGEITFVAMRDIYAGEELTFDYAMVDNEFYEFVCTCGSPNCRKKVTGYDWKIKQLQKKYSTYFAQYLLDKIKA